MHRPLLLAAATLLALPASAQTVASQIQACQAIADAQARLACYDRVSHGQPVPSAPPPSAPQAYAPPPAAAPNYTTQFGEEEVGVVSPAHQLRFIISAITDYKVDLRGKFTVSLANGQVWKQIEGDVTVALPRISATRVRIERGLLGSFNLTFNGMKPEYKVKRIR